MLHCLFLEHTEVLFSPSSGLGIIFSAIYTGQIICLLSQFQYNLTVMRQVVVRPIFFPNIAVKFQADIYNCEDISCLLLDRPI